MGGRWRKQLGKERQGSSQIRTIRMKLKRERKLNLKPRKPRSAQALARRILQDPRVGHSSFSRKVSNNLTIRIRVTTLGTKGSTRTGLTGDTHRPRSIRHLVLTISMHQERPGLPLFVLTVIAQVILLGSVRQDRPLRLPSNFSF